MRYSLHLLYTILFLLTFISSATAAAQRHAVLIGIADYSIKKLYGPANDVNALKETLIKKYGFSEKDITVLLNKEATKQNIMQTLSALKRTTEPGDFILVYFSGHGTSAHDIAISLPIRHSSGALMPYDFTLDKKDIQKTLSSLIIGRNDLKPLFTELDRDRKLFVIFDACFSGNTVRGLPEIAKGIPKYVPLEFIDDYEPEFRPQIEEPYPYRNIIYISASEETKKALDIPIASYDGKAHGALTNALLIGLDGAADTNHNHVITYEELYYFLRQRVQKYGHTPQVLHKISLNKPVFEETVRIIPPGITTPSGELKVKVVGMDSELLIRKINPIAGVTIADEKYDLLLTNEDSLYTLYLAGGDRLCSVRNVDEVVSRIKRYIRARELVGLSNSEQNFNVWLNVGGYEGKTVFFDGETVDFTIKSEEDAYLLLLNSDSFGYIQVLLPDSEEESRFIKKGQVLTLGEHGKVEPPFGFEYLKIFAFKEDISALRRFAGRELDPLSSQFQELMTLIKKNRQWAESVKEIVTYEKR